jgi:hypothetical protein
LNIRPKSAFDRENDASIRLQEANGMPILSQHHRKAQRKKGNNVT